MLNKAKAPAVTVNRMSSSTLFLPPAALSLSGSDWLNIFFPPSARPSVLTWQGGEWSTAEVMTVQRVV